VYTDLGISAAPTWGGDFVSNSTWWRFAKPLAVPIGAILFLGCGGEETIPLKKPDFLLEPTTKQGPDTKGDNVPGRSSRMKPEQRPGQAAR